MGLRNIFAATGLPLLITAVHLGAYPQAAPASFGGVRDRIVRAIEEKDIPSISLAVVRDGENMPSIQICDGIFGALLPRYAGAMNAATSGQGGRGPAERRGQHDRLRHELQPPIVHLSQAGRYEMKGRPS